MDEPNTPLVPVAATPGDEDLREEMHALKGVVTLLLVAMTCVTAVMALYLYRQAVTLKRQVAEGQRLTNEFQSNALPRISWFVTSLQAFGKTNADFNPILAKYNLLQTGGPPPGVAPPASPPKK